MKWNREIVIETGTNWLFQSLNFQLFSRHFIYSSQLRELSSTSVKLSNYVLHMNNVGQDLWILQHQNKIFLFIFFFANMPTFIFLIFLSAMNQAENLRQMPPPIRKNSTEQLQQGICKVIRTPNIFAYRSPLITEKCLCELKIIESKWVSFNFRISYINNIKCKFLLKFNSSFS